MYLNEKRLPRNCRKWFKRGLMLIALFTLASVGTGDVFADAVTDWNQNTINAFRTAGASSIATMRILAIEQAAVFDAVNGIERRFTHLYVKPNGPNGASSRAAAIQAAYTTLVRFFPSQRSSLDAQRDASLAAITDEGSGRIKLGINWGQKVADDILALRCSDGFEAIFPPYTGGTAPGEWRPTPPANLAGQTPELAHMTPFVMTSPDQFRPSGPRVLTSAEYTTDFNEVKTFGRADPGSTRSPEQTEIALFWADNNQLHWNRIALYIAAHRSDSLADNARTFALLSLATADANIAAWDAKYYYSWWRPITAIRLAATDGNDDTSPDATWSPLQTTNNHPEYVSGHSTISSAAARVLATIYGDNVTFTHGSDTLAGVTRTHTSFSTASDEANVSRVYAGAHFRSNCEDGQAVGDRVGNLVVAKLARPKTGDADE